jgi:hypothetical protein
MLLCNTSFPFYPRYLVPMVPMAGLLVASLLVEGAERLSQVARPAALVPAGAIATVAALAWPQAHESIQFVNHVTSPNTRAQAYEYLIQNFSPGAVVASEDRYLRLPRGYRLLRWAPLHSHAPEEFIEAGVDALVFTSEREPGARNDKREALRTRFPRQAEFSEREGTGVGPTVTIHLGRDE